MTFRWTVKLSTWCQSFPGTEKPFWTLWKRLDAALSLTKPPTLEDLEQRLLHLFRWNCMQLSWMSINITWPSLNCEYCNHTYLYDKLLLWPSLELMLWCVPDSEGDIYWSLVLSCYCIASHLHIWNGYYFSETKTFLLFPPQIYKFTLNQEPWKK